jgi:UDP-glucose 4-epimerase
MILVTGGAGFIGSHTTQALRELGEECVVVQRRPADTTVERVDVGDRAALLAVGQRHRITGIVHLAGSVPWPPDDHPPVDSTRAALDGLLNVVHAAIEWQVPRLCVASTIGVYGGVTAPAPWSEDLPLPMTSGHVIPAFKKIGELLTDHLARATGLDIVNLRIGAIWGPGGRPASPFFPAPQLVHAAARGSSPDLSTLYTPAYADDCIDMCYVKDCARAIALLQLAPTLNHRTYNVSAGRTTSNREVITALKALVPAAEIDLPAGRNPHGPADDTYLEITRLTKDTGFQPAYNTARAVADYLGWLRAGNPR